MSHKYRLFDVFSRKPFDGNQLAVFENADDLSEEQMRAIARELNLSETSFVIAKGGTARARFFTPSMELPFAGHPTLGTAAALAAAGNGTSAHEIALLEGIGELTEYRIR